MERPRLTLVQRREVRRLRGKGLKLHEIVASIGCSRATVTRVLSSPGEMESREAPWNPGSSRLSLAEREEISLGLRGGESFRAIATRLDRSPSTISREVAANGGRSRYRAVWAHDGAYLQSRRPKTTKLVAGAYAIRSPRGSRSGGRLRRSPGGCGSSSRTTRACR